MTDLATSSWLFFCCCGWFLYTSWYKWTNYIELLCIPSLWLDHLFNWIYEPANHSGSIVHSRFAISLFISYCLGYSAEDIIGQMNLSLASLNVDFVQIYYLHFADHKDVPIGETLNAVNQLYKGRLQLNAEPFIYRVTKKSSLCSTTPRLFLSSSASIYRFDLKCFLLIFLKRGSSKSLAFQTFHTMNL